MGWDLAVKMAETGEWTLAQAAKHVNMDVTTFLSRLRAAVAAGGEQATLAAKTILRVEQFAATQEEAAATRYTLRQATKAAARRGAFSLLSWPALIAGTLILGATGVGIYMYTNWGKPSEEPVKLGAAGERHERTTLGPQPAALTPSGAPSGAAMGPIDTSGEWRVSWNWSVTTVNFVGQLTGGAGAWSFAGKIEGGGNAVWTAEKGAGSITCSVTGSLEPPYAAKATCSATMPDGKAWTCEAEGTLQQVESGGKRKFAFRGSGWGDAGGGRAHVDHLDLAPTGR